MKTANRTVKKVPLAGIKLKRLSALLLGLTPILLASPSYALDYKVYPGSGCQPVVGAQSGSFRRDNGSITYVGTDSGGFVNCPLERDWIPASASLDPGAWVASPNGGVLICEFYSKGQRGNHVDSVFRSTTASTPTPLIFSGRPIRTEGAGSYYIQCKLPPQGRVINYSIGEAGQTGDL
jgi:hypothetical protein